MEFEEITAGNMQIRSSVTSGLVVIWYLAKQDCIITENDV
jgi:hypothetical protein